LLVEIIDSDDPAAASLFDLMERRRTAIWKTNGLDHYCDEASGEEIVDRDWFVRRYNPLSRLLIAGSDPVSLAVAMLGIQAGFETYLFRPLGPSDAPPIRYLNYISSPSHQSLSAGFLDRWSYVAVCSHDQTRDAEILDLALNSEAPYVGLLGSRRRLPQLYGRLREVRVAPKQLLKLRAPIGIDLGISSQFEIAIAIIAEMISVRNAAAN
jgi:xanthine dehydrogenase accessory factor